MDTNYFHGFLGIAVLERKKLSAGTDGQGSMEGMEGVKLLPASLKVVEKATPRTFRPREHTTGGFQTTLPDVHVML